MSSESEMNALADRLTRAYEQNDIATITDSKQAGPQHRLVGGTAFHFSDEDQRGTYDYLFVDEAGQVSLGNLVAMAGAAANIVLVGDQMQLPQPVQAAIAGVAARRDGPAQSALIEALYAERVALGAKAFDALVGRVRRSLRAAIDRQAAYSS